MLKSEDALKAIDLQGNLLDGRSIRATKKLPAYQQESVKSRVHGMGYHDMSKFQDLDITMAGRR